MMKNYWIRNLLKLCSQKISRIIIRSRQIYGIGIYWLSIRPCIPSIQRLFVDVDGFFYPAKELVKQMSLIYWRCRKGIEIDEVENFNISNYNRELCRNCFAFRECGFCVRSCQKKPIEF